jgi:hypothetical protein
VLKNCEGLVVVEVVFGVVFDGVVVTVVGGKGVPLRVVKGWGVSNLGGASNLETTGGATGVTWEGRLN